MMKRVILIAALGVAAIAAPAVANETEDFCVAFATDHEIGTEPCSCIGEVGEANPDLKEAILALTSPDEVEGWDDALKEKIGVCFPQDG